MCSPLLSSVVDQRPYTILHRELVVLIPDLWKYTDFEPTHGEQKVGVVPAVDAGEGILPLNSGNRPRN